MKKRTLWKMFLLEIVTLGIYRLYYFIKTRREMMNLNPKVKIMSPWFLLAPLGVVLIALTFLIVSIASSASRTTTLSTGVCNTYSSNASTLSNTNLGLPPNCNTNTSPASLAALLVFYLAIIVAVVLFIVWEWSYSHGVDIITGSKLSFALTLIILILVPDGIDILIVQDYFNKVGEKPAPEQMPVPPTPVNPVAPAAS